MSISDRLNWRINRNLKLVKSPRTPCCWWERRLPLKEYSALWDRQCQTWGLNSGGLGYNHLPNHPISGWFSGSVVLADNTVGPFHLRFSSARPWLFVQLFLLVCFWVIFLERWERQLHNVIKIRYYLASEVWRTMVFCRRGVSVISFNLVFSVFFEWWGRQLHHVIRIRYSLSYHCFGGTYCLALTENALSCVWWISSDPVGFS
jgi:hypothetical protein